MRLTLQTLLFAALAGLVNAHFQLQFPAPRGAFVEDQEPTFCDGYNTASSNRTAFPLSGGFYSLNSEHPRWTVGVLVSTVANPTSFDNFSQALPFTQLTGEGAFCLPLNFATSNVTGLSEGQNVTIQIQFDGGDSPLFQCADVTLTNNASLSSRRALLPYAIPSLRFWLNMLFTFRRREVPWEVVDSKSVHPVPMYYEDEDIDIVTVAEADTCGTYVFDVKNWKRGNELRNAVLFAQKQLLKNVSNNGYNVLLLESWQLTVLRRGKHHRVEYSFAFTHSCPSCWETAIKAPTAVHRCFRWRPSNCINCISIHSDSVAV
ncbi:hypothetical protein EYR36_007213 [Pleurotus pulmonarius]|nr:hypothetical protein EYR36_007213 [Pleurotus pulmonarius]